MYKVYLSPSTQDKSFGVGDFGVEEFRMNQIADVVEQSLLQSGEYAVFRNVSGMTKEEIIADSNDAKPNIHVAIHSNYGNKPGCECYVKVGDETSNGFGKEVYKEVLALHYDKNIDNGLVYDKNIDLKTNTYKTDTCILDMINSEIVKTNTYKNNRLFCL